MRSLDRLPNGLRVVTVELPHLHTASLVMYSRVGSRYESAADNGLSHFLEHMLFRGTARLPDAFQLNHAIEAVGGTLYAETGRDYSLYQIRLHPDSLDESVALFGEIFASPQFSEIEVERRIILEEMLEDHDAEGRLINIDDLARSAVWPAHPLGQRITGPTENVERFTVEDLRRHFGKHYGARNMVLAVAGAVERAPLMPLIERAFGILPPGEEHPIAPPAPSGAQAAPNFVYVDDEGSQASVQILFRGLPENAPQVPALVALARVVDDGMSTRLHRRLCDELGLAYYVSSTIDHLVDTGLFEVDGTCGPKNVPALVRESLALLGRLRDQPPTVEELEKARRRYRWDLLHSFDDPDAMAGWFGGSELFSAVLGPPHSLDEKLARLAAVTPEAVTAVARSLFRRERLTVACVGRLPKRAQAELRKIVESFE